VARFTAEPDKHWEQLSAVKAQLSLPPVEHPKIPTKEESKGFKERMAEYQQKLEDAKINLKGKTYREFEENKIKLGHKEFDQAIYDEYRDYLLSIPENETMILPVHYLYQRVRFIGMKEQAQNLKKLGYVPINEREESQSPKASDRRGTGPSKVYKTWMND